MRLTATCMAALAAASMTAGAAELRLSGPFTHDNLSIYLVHGQDRVQKKYLTLAEALEQHKVVVYETSNVNVLQVENLSAQDVYIQSGEIVKGGKQDRVLKDDIIVPSASGKLNVNAFCVEHGRWTQRGNEPAKNFAASPNAIASPAMKRAVKDTGQQTQVWAEAANVQQDLAARLSAPVAAAASPSSYQLTLEAPAVKQTTEAFKKDLAGLADKNPDALGYVAAVNGKVTGSDVYGTHELFRKEWPKLLEAAAVEAMAAPKLAGNIALPPPADVKAAATGYGARVNGESQVNSRTDGVQADLPQGLVYETRDAEAPAAGPVHRTYVSK
ncbi:MAG: ARPP-1 family domain-containing protein [Bryobacteraceae bacterium]